jgi:hypothetical protein
MIAELATIEMQTRCLEKPRNLFEFWLPIILAILALGIIGAKSGGWNGSTRCLITYSGTVCGFVGSEIEIAKYLTGWVELALRDTACSAPGYS